MTTALATTKQTSLIATLIDEKELSDTKKNVADSFLADPNLTKAQASSLITALMSEPRKPKPVTAAPTAEVPEGMHKVGDDIYKVQRAVHGSGHLYAKKLVRDYTGTSFEFTPGAIRSLSADTAMSLEQAQEYGAVYGVCCVCARTLTNESSIEAGIGPICAGKF